jgi:hypothetical protein
VVAQHYQLCAGRNKYQTKFAECFLHSVRTLLSFRLLPEYVRDKMHRTIIFFSVAAYGCQTWSLTLRGEYTEGVREQGAEEGIWA